MKKIYAITAVVIAISVAGCSERDTSAVSNDKPAAPAGAAEASPADEAGKSDSAPPKRENLGRDAYGRLNLKPMKKEDFRMNDPKDGAK